MSIPHVETRPPDAEEDEDGGRDLAWVSVDINLRDGSSFQADINMPDSDGEPTAEQLAEALYRCALAAAYARGADVVFALQQRMQGGGE